MKVMLIGGAGWLGYHGSREWIKRGHPVNILALLSLAAEFFRLNRTPRRGPEYFLYIFSFSNFLPGIRPGWLFTHP